MRIIIILTILFSTINLYAFDKCPGPAIQKYLEEQGVFKDTKINVEEQKDGKWKIISWVSPMTQPSDDFIQNLINNYTPPKTLEERVSDLEKKIK